MEKSTQNEFKIIIAFQSHGMILVEARKAISRMAGAPAAPTVWLCVKEKTSELEEYVVINKGRDDGLHVVEFEDATFSFDSEIGELIFEEERGFALDRVPPESTSAKVSALIAEFFAAKSI